MAITSRKTVIIKRPTRLDQLIARFNSRQQVKFYIEHIHGDYNDYERENEIYYRSLDSVINGIDRVCRIHVIDWTNIPNYQFGGDDIIATVGQDGLIVNALKYVNDRPVVGFNSDPGRWDGALAQFGPGDAPDIIRKCLNDEAPHRSVTKALVRLSDNQALYAVNDFFIGVSSHASARYAITYDKRQEVHSSSGVIVSTPLGRSGWMKSVLTGAGNIAGRVANKKIKGGTAAERIEWSEEGLYFAVREPFPSVSSSTDIVYGKVTNRTVLEIESKMGENGLIFSDGIQSDFLNFNYSVKAVFTIAGEKGKVIVKD